MHWDRKGAQSGASLAPARRHHPRMPLLLPCGPHHRYAPCQPPDVIYGVIPVHQLAHGDGHLHTMQGWQVQGGSAGWLS